MNIHYTDKNRRTYKERKEIPTKIIIKKRGNEKKGN